MASSKVTIPIELRTAEAQSGLKALFAEVEAAKVRAQREVGSIAARTGEAVRQRTTVPFEGVKFVDPKTGERRRISGEIVIDTTIKSAKEQQLETEKEIAALRKQALIAVRRNVRDIQRRSQRSMSAARRREAQQERDENWFTTEQKRIKQEDIKDKKTRGMETSRMMMGGAGVLTALTMPISGFTPLTIGFASMSGVGFGIAAAGAVFVRAVIDGSKALNTLQDKLKDTAVAANAVSERYKEQDAMMKGRGVAQGFLAAEQAADRLGKWNKALEDSIGVMSVANEAWGQVRMDISGIGRDITMFTLGASEDRPFGSRSSYMKLGARFMPNVLFSILGAKYGAETFDKGLESFAGRGPAIKEALDNLGKNFNAAFVKPEDLYNRIQKAAVSRKPENEKMIEYQRKALEELYKQTELAKKELEVTSRWWSPERGLLELFR